MSKGFKIAYKLGIIAVSILAVIFISSVILVVLDAPILKTFYTICIMPLTRSLHITEILIRAIPLAITAIGVSVAYRSGIINIGAEGQMAMGILAFTATALALPDVPRPVLLPFAMLMAALYPRHPQGKAQRLRTPKHSHAELHSGTVLYVLPQGCDDGPC